MVTPDCALRAPAKRISSRWKARRSRSSQQRSCEGAGYSLFAFACARGGANHDDMLASASEMTQARLRAAAGLVIKPLAQRRRREQLPQSGRARNPAADHPIDKTAQPETVFGAGGNDDTLERRQQCGRGGDISGEAEHDALA